jgi:hypothetical protein
MLAAFGHFLEGNPGHVSESEKCFSSGRSSHLPEECDVDVRKGSNPDLAGVPSQVRFSPDTGHLAL